MLCFICNIMLIACTLFWWSMNYIFVSKILNPVKNVLCLISTDTSSSSWAALEAEKAFMAKSQDILRDFISFILEIYQVHTVSEQHAILGYSAVLGNTTPHHQTTVYNE